MSSQIIQEPEADVVVMGLGFIGGIVATELAVNAKLKVVGIDKGLAWDFVNDFALTKYDEWGIGIGRKFDHPLPISSVTIRNNRNQFANPVRKYTMPIQYHALGHGTGGAAQHYGGNMGRQGPWGYKMYSDTVNKYGKEFLDKVNPHSDLEDWPMTYEEYEPYYVTFEKAYGLTGTNQGPLVPMSQNYPVPPHPETPLGKLFSDAATALGYHPYPNVSALNSTKTYVNQYGVSVAPCAYDGWCGANCNYVCETGAKGTSANRVLPAALKSGNFTIATQSYIFRIDTDPTSKKATAVRYVDTRGTIHVQPGKVFFNGLWGYNIVRMMLLSGIGKQYDPVTLTGTAGRGLTNGYTPYRGTSVNGTLDVGGNSYPAGNATGGSNTMYDLMDDNFDHKGLDFIGGTQVTIGGYLGGGPGNLTTIAGVVGPTSMGSDFKKSLKDKYLTKKRVVGSTPFAPDLPTTDNYVDLDPHYTDIYGDPLARLTYDWTPNTYNGATYLAPIVGKILEKMGCKDVKVGAKVSPGSAHNDWWGHHLRGGYRLGKDPKTSALNKWQQCWDCENVFAASEMTNTSGDTVPSGTHVVGPQAYVAAEGIQKYLKSPGPLVA
ncbi:MAG: GMC oxidoreductase [Thaumarchaeota archaeon]|nr:GMC oxidoreductase [Nitrososphaerota archaeon]MCL5318919.1 GMC oxidoreductase [Nitrososphaerota archaeon]